MMTIVRCPHASICVLAMRPDTIDYDTAAVLNDA
jgi:hypothetical protein